MIFRKPKIIDIVDLKTSLAPLLNNLKTISHTTSSTTGAEKKSSNTSKSLSSPFSGEYFEPLKPFEVMIEEKGNDCNESSGNKK